VGSGTHLLDHIPDRDAVLLRGLGNVSSLTNRKDLYLAGLAHQAPGPGTRTGTCELPVDCSAQELVLALASTRP
jgi:hypothetical protein